MIETRSVGVFVNKVRTRLGFSVLICLLAGLSVYADPPTVKVVGNTPAAAIENHITADVVISGLDMSPHSLGAFDLNLNYSAAIL